MLPEEVGRLHLLRVCRFGFNGKRKHERKESNKLGEASIPEAARFRYSHAGDGQAQLVHVVYVIRCYSSYYFRCAWMPDLRLHHRRV